MKLSPVKKEVLSRLQAASPGSLTLAEATSGRRNCMPVLIGMRLAEADRVSDLDFRFRITEAGQIALAEAEGIRS